MLINLMGSLILIGMSFIVRAVAEDSLKTQIITWSMFGVGLIILIMVLMELFRPVDI